MGLAANLCGDLTSPIVRYLYGDSDPFPLDYNFLETIESFVEHGAMAAHHDAVVKRLESAIAAADAKTDDARKILNAFTGEVCQSIGEARALAPASAAVVAYVDRVMAFAEQTALEAISAEDAQAVEKNSTGRAEVEEHRRGMRTELEAFLLQGVLGGELVHTTLTLEGPSGYAIEATRRLIGGLEVTYHIDTSRFAEWTQQRTVESVAGAMEIQIGMKKKFLRRDLTRELMRVGDHTIVRALMDESGAEIAIKKSVDSPKPPLTLMLSREGDQLEAFIERSDADVFPAIPSDAEKISGLWEALESVGRHALDFRDAVVSVRHEEEDLLTGAGIHGLIDVLMDAYAPIANKIDQKSPSSRELSLKREHESGRREELYLDKAALRVLLEDKDDVAKERFMRLPLEDRASRVPPAVLPLTGKLK